MSHEPTSGVEAVLKRAAYIARAHSHHALWEGLPTDSLNGFGVALAQRIESAIRRHAALATPAASPAMVEARVRAFQEWLNDRRQADVSSVFHEIVDQYRAALATPAASPATDGAFPTKVDLISAISLAENYISEHIEKYHDYEDDTPERASLRGIEHHFAGSLIGDDGEFIRAASPSPAPASETWRDLDDERLKRAIDAFYDPCEGTTIDGIRNAILAWERG